MKTINIGILAHVDAGKTTLTEQILYKAGVIGQPGSVDNGTTTTDSLEIERKRGITVKSAAVSFMVGDLKVNLIDTPGHADFISEVEHALSVLDGVILVVSAVEGVQAQTRVLMQTLKEHRFPTVIFMNKIDRMGADYDRIRDMIQSRLDERICEMNEVVDAGSPSVRVNRSEPAARGWVETLALNDDGLLRDFVDGIPLPADRLHAELRKQTRQGEAFPLFAGSAAKGIGVGQLLDCVGDFFPAGDAVEGSAKPLSGLVFKIVKQPAGERTVYIRLFEGTLRVREEITVLPRQGQAYRLKVKKLYALQNGKTVPAGYVSAGDIAVLTGGEWQVGDVTGGRSAGMKALRFRQPPIQVKAEAVRKEEAAILHQALSDLTLEDPFLQYRHDESAGESVIRLFGTIQREILAETIRQQYGIEARFSEPSVVCIEKPAGKGEAAESIGEANNPFWATVGFRVEPGLEGSGLRYRLEAELGSLPPAFQKAIRETVVETLQEGLHGWNVTDVVVTLTHTGYASPVSTAKDFRSLVPLVLMSALERAGTKVLEPVNDMRLTLPESGLSKVLSLLTRLEGVFREPEFARGAVTLSGSIPVRTSDSLKAELHSLTSGEGLLAVRPGGYIDIKGAAPENSRRQPNPLNRGEYLLRLSKVL